MLWLRITAVQSAAAGTAAGDADCCRLITASAQQRSVLYSEWNGDVLCTQQRPLLKLKNVG